MPPLAVARLLTRTFSNSSDHPRNRFRLRVEPLEDRWNPDTYVWSPQPGSTDAAVPANWLVNGDPATATPGPFDVVLFPPGGADCTNFGGTFAAVYLDERGYTGTVSGSGAIEVGTLGVRSGSFRFGGPVEVEYLDVWGGAYAELGAVTAEEVSVLGGTLVLNGPMTAEQLSVSGGTIDQGSASASVTVTGPVASPYAAAFVFTGGTVNSTTNLANLILSGSAATALIAPANAGTVSLGSNFLLVGGAVATMKEGTVQVTNNIEFDIGEYCGIEVDPGQGNAYTLQATVGIKPQIDIDPNGFMRLLSGTCPLDSAVYNRGEFTLMPGTTMQLNSDLGQWVWTPGGWQWLSDKLTYYQDGGVTRLYNGSTLEVWLPVQIAGGKLSTVDSAGESSATIEGDLSVTGGEVVIGNGSIPHAFGILYVAGDVEWTGGTYRPVVLGVEDEGPADLW